MPREGGAPSNRRRRANCACDYWITRFAGDDIQACFSAIKRPQRKRHDDGDGEQCAAHAGDDESYGAGRGADQKSDRDREHDQQLIADLLVFADRRGAVPAAGKPPPRHDDLGDGDAELRHVAGHDVGLRNAFHQEPDQHALRAHGAGREQAGDDAAPVVGAGDVGHEEDDGDESREQGGFEAEHPRQWRAALGARQRDQRRGDRGRRHEGDDGKELAGDA